VAGHLVSHVWLKGEACRRGERCRVSLHKALTVITGVQPLHSPLQNIQALVPRGFHAVFCWQVGAQCPAQASMVAEVTTLLKHKHPLAFNGEENMNSVDLCGAVSQTRLRRMNHCFKAFIYKWSSRACVLRVIHPGFHLMSHPHTISPSLSYPPTYTNSPAVFILVWAGLTSVKVKETRRSDRPDTADHHQPAANSNEQNNRHGKPGWEMAPLFNLLASLDTRLSVHDI